MNSAGNVLTLIQADDSGPAILAISAVTYSRFDVLKTLVAVGTAEEILAGFEVTSYRGELAINQVFGDVNVPGVVVDAVRTAFAVPS